MLDICDDLWQSLCDQRFDLVAGLNNFLLKLAARIDLPDGARHSLHSSASVIHMETSCNMHQMCHSKSICQSCTSLYQWVPRSQCDPFL